MKYLQSIHWRAILRTYWVYGALAVLVMAPLLMPGYVFTLDLVFTPVMPAPDAFAHDYLWEGLLHTASLVLPSQLLQKCILLSIPLLAGIGMHRLLSVLRAHIGEQGLAWTAAIYAAGILFAVNPFTYARFMTGQYAVLIGYALLPWCMLLALRFIQAPGWRSLCKLTALALVISIISIHTLGEAVIIAGAVLAYGLYAYPQRRKQIVQYGAVAAAIFVAASSYWLLPLILGKSGTAATIQSFDASHAAAFATVGDSMVTRIINVLSLQGFWTEARDLYRLPQEQLPLWGTIRLLLWVVAGFGWVALWRRNRAYAVVCASIGIIGLIVAVGAFQPLLTMLGYREPHKFTGLVALILAIVVACGAARLIYRAGQRSNTHYSIATSSIFIVVLVFTPTMYWGFGGQLSSRHYPSDWYQLDQRLAAEQGHPVSLFLPWHQYLPLDFAGRTIANPATNFFATPVLTSQDPELGTIPSPRAQRTLDRVFSPDGNQRDELSAALQQKHIKYVIVSLDYQPEQYEWLDTQPTLKKVWHTESIVLYRNTLYTK